MPCFGTTDKTLNNSLKLMQELGVTSRTVNIADSVRRHFKDIGHDEKVKNAAYEKRTGAHPHPRADGHRQRRKRTCRRHGRFKRAGARLATYNGDHMSMYGVNASVPKTLVKYLIRHEAARLGGEAEKVLTDILNTEISPELLPPENGKIAQKTEELVGPYELHDFYLYYAVRWGFSPKKVYFLRKKGVRGRIRRRNAQKVARQFFISGFSRSSSSAPVCRTGSKSARLRSRRGGIGACRPTRARPLWLAEAEAL